MEFSQIIAFALVAALLVISPGPNGLLIIKTVSTSGRLAGFANIVGFVAAFYIHGTFSILGISVILLNSAELFLLVKSLGALYLCWLGFRALRSAYSSPMKKAEVPNLNSEAEISVSKALVEGFLTNAFNPKVSIFYLAAFPQFVPLDGDVSAAYLLVFVHSLLNIIWFSSMVLLLSKFVAFGRKGQFQKILKTITGVIFVGFGIKLASMNN